MPCCLHDRFQELDLSASAFLLDNSAREEDWTRLIDQGIRNRKNYRKVECAARISRHALHTLTLPPVGPALAPALRAQLVSKQLVGMLLIVYVKMEHMSHIKDVSTGSIGTGIMGMMARCQFPKSSQRRAGMR